MLVRRTSTGSAHRKKTRMRRSDLTVSIICAIGGLAALAVALTSATPVGLPGLLGVILLVNAAARFVLARTS